MKMLGAVSANEIDVSSLAVSDFNDDVIVTTDCPQFLNEPNRVWFSSSVAAAATQSREGLRYADDAFIPSADWQCTVLSRAQPNGALKQEHSNTVAIVKLFEVETILSLQQHIEQFRMKPIDQDKYLSDPFLAYLMEAINEVCTVDGRVMYHGIADDPIALDTVSFDPAIGRLVGIHVDDWDRLPVSHLHKARNRISINTGVEDRYFIFIRKTVQGIAALTSTPTSDTPKTISEKYLQGSSEKRIIRVRVRPGEAYIAPADNLLHDGSTVGLKRRVSHVSFRAFISLRNSIGNLNLVRAEARF